MPTTPISHPLALERLRDARDPVTGEIDVLRAAIAIASHIRPTLAPARIQATFDRFIRDVAHIVRHDNPPQHALKHVLFLRHAFAGNRHTYQDPRNSYIDTVLERRSGLPILLSLVYVQTARRSGYQAHGIGLPGHFIAAFDVDGNAGRRIYIDTFNGGVELGIDACRRAVATTGTPWRDEYLEPVDSVYWTLRMLGNLRGTYTEMGDLANTAAVLEQMLVVAPDDVSAARGLQETYQLLDGQSARNN